MEKTNDVKDDAGLQMEKILGDDIKIETPYIDSSVKKLKKRKKIIRNVIVSLAVIAGAAYAGGAIYFKNHFDDQTTINGIDVSGKTIEEVKGLIKADQDKYSLSVKFKDSDETIKSNQAGIVISSSETVDSIKSKQNYWTWPFNFGNNDEYEIEYKLSYDDAKLKEVISGFSAMNKLNTKESENAYVSISNGEVEIIPDKTGTKLDEEKVLLVVGEALSNYSESVDIEKEGCYVEAFIKEDSPVILSGYEEAYNFVNMKACYDFAGYELPISKEDLGNMITINSFGHIELIKSRVDEFAANFAEKYTTCYTDRKFKTHDGKMIDVYGGYYGWDIDGETEAEELYEYLLAGEDFVKEPACNKKGYALCELNDIGENYIEIDLSDQMVFVISNGVQIFSTQCVSGNVSWGMSTPGGLYPLSYKERYATLRGPGYETKVSYWMPFNGGIGLHDATWKSKFGGDIYKYDGSHGCINLPLESAAFIFDYVEKGSPIVCYWED